MLFKCSKCIKAFTRLRNLKKHVMIKHYNIRKYECIKCLKRYAHNNSLKKH